MNKGEINGRVHQVEEVCVCELRLQHLSQQVKVNGYWTSVSALYHNNPANTQLISGTLCQLLFIVAIG